MGDSIRISIEAEHSILMLSEKCKMTIGIIDDNTEERFSRDRTRIIFTYSSIVKARGTAAVLIRF